MNNHERPIKRPRNNQQAHVDFISSLPDDCLWHVFSFLPTETDQVACSAVSKRWFSLQLDMVCSSLTKSNHQIASHEASRNLVGSSDLSLAAMIIGIGYNEKLRHVSLRPLFQSKSCQITDVGVSMLTGVCTRLRAISLCNCTMIGNIGIACIAYNCNSLERFELANSWLITDEGFTLLVMKCVSLSFVSLSTCHNISNRSLKAIARYSINLKSLELVNLPLVNACGVTSIISNRLPLVTLKLMSINLSDNVLSSTTWSLTELKNVAIRNPGPELSDLRFLTKLVKLENLYLEGFEFIDSFSGLMNILANCRNTLTCLELVRCMTCESKISLSDFSPGKHNFPSLQRVRLKQCRNISDDFLFIIGQACQSIKEVNLVEIDSITNQGIIRFMQNSPCTNQIRKIEVTSCTKVGNPSVWAITKACGHKLTSLVIKKCGLVTDRGVGIIGSRCPSLINLDLGWTQVTDAGLRQIVDARLFYLEELSLRRCTEITDASLVAIVNAPFLISLERVALTGCTGLTKKGLELLKSMEYELI